MQRDTNGPVLQATDFLGLEAHLEAGEVTVRDAARRLVTERVLPEIAGW